MTYHVITLFPESLESYLNASIVKRAREDGKITVKYYNPRDFALPRRSTEGTKAGTVTPLSYAERRVDDRPYGGGPGMVMEALPIIKAVEKAIENAKVQIPNDKSISKVKKNQKPKIKILFFNPSGKQFTNKIADSYKKYTDIVLVCGRYEGIDARVKKAFPMADVSVGPYTLTGGELPAMIVIDAVTRRIPGVLGDNLSVEEERIASPDVYTRPEVIEYNGKKLKVPKILLSGHHLDINKWKMEKSKWKII